MSQQEQIRVSQPSGFARPRGHHGIGPYTGAELTDTPIRTGADKANSLPRRVNQHLFWPDGRVTDLGRKEKP